MTFEVGVWQSCPLDKGTTLATINKSHPCEWDLTNLPVLARANRGDVNHPNKHRITLKVRRSSYLNIITEFLQTRQQFI